MTLPDRDVLLCRDCCCGSGSEHPRTDRPHDTLLGGVVDATATEQVVAWVRDGGTLPTGLMPHRFGQTPRGREQRG